MDKLTQDFANSLIASAEDGIKDCLEIGIDSFIEDGILKEIPIVSTIVSGLKFAKNIYDRNLLKQTLSFINELNNGTLSEEELIVYQSIILNNPKKCEEELGRVLIYLNNFLDKEKSEMLAKLYKAYISKIISWNQFCEYAEIINRIFLQDITILKELYEDKYKNIEEIKERYRLDRLTSLGLIKFGSKSRIENSTLIIDDNIIDKTNLGGKIYNIIK